MRELTAIELGYVSNAGCGSEWFWAGLGCLSFVGSVFGTYATLGAGIFWVNVAGVGMVGAGNDLYACQHEND